MTDRKSRETERRISDIASSQLAVSSATESAAKAKAEFAKPDKYAGNRELYDSPAAKRIAKNKAFAESEVIKDRYTGNDMVAKRLEARKRYGDDWQNHTAEVDHKKSIANIFNENKKDPFIKNNDIKEVANCDENLTVTTRKINNAKRQRTNSEFVNDSESLERAQITLTEEGKKAAVNDGITAEKVINEKLKHIKIDNIKTTFHEAGLEGAKYAGFATLIISGPINLVSAHKGEKTYREALRSTAADTAESAAVGYISSGALTIISQSVSNTGNQILIKILNPEIFGPGITFAIAGGKELKAYLKGEKSSKEVVESLGEKAAAFAAGKHVAKLLSELFPNNPVVVVVGGVLGSALASTVYRSIVKCIKNRKTSQPVLLDDNRRSA